MEKLSDVFRSILMWVCIIGVFGLFTHSCGGPGSSGGANPSGGSAVTCNDGSVSMAGGRQGACSHHGGER